MAVERTPNRRQRPSRSPSLPDSTRPAFCRISPAARTCVAGCAPNAFEGLATQWFDPKCFSLNAFGTFGNLGRNTGFGPDLWNTDFALLKNTRVPKISESFNIQFRAEIFDIFNHANFGLPNTTMFTAGANGGGNVNPNAGRITSIATPTPARQIQLALKFIFSPRRGPPYGRKTPPISL